MILPKFYMTDDFTPFEDDILAHGGIRRRIPARTRLHEATSEVHTAYYIRHGLAKFSLLTEEGAENIIFFYGEGSIFPVNCSTELFTLETFMSFSAITDLEVITFPAARLPEIACGNQDFVAAIILHYSHYASSVLMRSMLHTYNDSMRVVSTFLCLYCAHSTPKNLVDLSQEEIGNMLGLSRVQVSRVVSVLKRENIIEVNRKSIRILDLNKLKYQCSSLVTL